ncbi:hypothetical protein TNCV_844031 [Trichonephila clavipes]|nr:hypothetical protein TNCV_844031 [Trichonephila clavipes]
MIRKKGYKPQPLKTTNCGEILFPRVETNGATCHIAGLRVGKECVRICNEQTTCSDVVSLFSIRQTGYQKLQYDKERPARFSTAEITTARIGEK